MMMRTASQLNNSVVSSRAGNAVCGRVNHTKSSFGRRTYLQSKKKSRRTTRGLSVTMSSSNNNFGSDDDISATSSVQNVAPSTVALAMVAAGFGSATISPMPFIAFADEEAFDVAQVFIISQHAMSINLTPYSR